MVALSDLIKEAIALPKVPKKKIDEKTKNPPKKINNSGNTNGRKRKREEVQQKRLEEDAEELSNTSKIAPRKIQKILSYHHAVSAMATSAVGSSSGAVGSIANVDNELWHYLQKELFHRVPISRLRVIELIHQLAVALPQFRLILAEDLQLIARSAGLLPSVSMSTKIKEMVKGTGVDQTKIVDCVKEKVEIWDTLFGNEIEKFHSMKRYFTESLRLEMPNLQEKAKQVQEAERERQRIERRKTLIRGEQIVKKGWLTETTQSVKSAIQSIEECFTILFPGLDQNTSTNQSSCFIEKSSKDDEVESEIPEIDWNTIEWVSGEADHEEDEEEENFEYQGFATSHTLPFTIEFELSTSANDISNGENEDVIAIVREHVSHLTKYDLPKLLEWQQVFTEVISILEQNITEFNNVGNSSSSSITTSSSFMVDYSFSAVQANAILSRTKRTLSELTQLIEEVKNLLSGRCKELFQS